MRIPFLLIIVSLLMSLSACSQAVPPSANNPVSTTLVDTTAALAATPSPIATPPGGGEYWIASTNRDTQEPYYVFITRPLVDAAPEIIFEAEAGYYPKSLYWSPDGQYLVFTDGDNGGLTRAFYVYDRVSRQLQTFDLQQLTGKPGSVDNIAWSPDTQSRQLAFNLCDSLFQCSPWLANILQGEASPINFPNSTWLWEPSGKSLIFSAQDAITRFDLSSMTGEELTLPTQSLLVENGRLRVAGFFPNLNGFLTSVTEMDGTRSYTLISGDGSQETLLFQADQGWVGQMESHPLLSPDGKQIGFNFSGQDDSTSFISSRLDQLPLKIPAASDLNDGVMLLWSPDNSVYVTRIALSENGPFSLGFYDAQTGSLLRTYEPSSPFHLLMSRDSKFEGILPIRRYSYFDSVWIP
jgi:dipeptidyl aminopeptidase/acylaminoacyl peptidase